MRKLTKHQIIREWYSELKSGTHEQCKNVLTKLSKDGKIIGHCCLGVLTHHVAQMRGKKKPRPDCTLMGYGSHCDTLELPPSLSRIFYSPTPELRVPHKLRRKCNGCYRVSAAILNDRCGFTFEQIADCIRYTWPEAFEENP